MRLKAQHAIPIALAASVVTGCGGPKAAPPTRALPLMSGVRVLESVSSGSDVDASNKNRYRRMFLAGPQGTTSEALLRAEVRFLKTRGWKRADVFYEGRGTDRTLEAWVDSPSRDISAYITTVAKNANPTAVEPAIYPATKTRDALLRGEPVLNVSLANGPHSKR